MCVRRRVNDVTRCVCNGLKRINWIDCVAHTHESLSNDLVAARSAITKNDRTDIQGRREEDQTASTGKAFKIIR